MDRHSKFPETILPEGLSNSTSSSLLARARSREEGAWERLIYLYSPLVYHWAKRAGLQPSDASDVLQETFCSVTSALPQFQLRQTGGSFRGWLRTIVQRKIIDLRRRAGPVGRGGSQTQRELTQVPAPMVRDSESFQGTEQTALVRRALEIIRPEFQEQTWKAFWQATVDGRTAADIAADLGMTKGGVRQASYRVRRRFHEEFAGLLD